MRIEPDLDKVIFGQRGMLRAIEVCLDSECLVGAVSLIFVSMDALAALTRPKTATRATRQEFINWVEKYVEPSETLACSPLDLYAARCSVLHTYGTESDLSQQEKARPIVYEWRRGPSADASLSLPPRALVLVVDQLHEVFCKAVQHFLDDAETNPNLESLIKHHLKTMLCYRPWPQLVAYRAA